MSWNLKGGASGVKVDDKMTNIKPNELIEVNDVQSLVKLELPKPNGTLLSSLYNPIQYHKGKYVSYRYTNNEIEIFEIVGDFIKSEFKSLGMFPFSTSYFVDCILNKDNEVYIIGREGYSTPIKVWKVDNGNLTDATTTFTPVAIPSTSDKKRLDYCHNEMYVFYNFGSAFEISICNRNSKNWKRIYQLNQRIDPTNVSVYKTATNGRNFSFAMIIDGKCRLMIIDTVKARVIKQIEFLNEKNVKTVAPVDETNPALYYYLSANFTLPYGKGETHCMPKIYKANITNNQRTLIKENLFPVDFEIIKGIENTNGTILYGGDKVWIFNKSSLARG